ncbi:DUF262 domain-containing protein [Neogemmobacter tilapiae]|uniref:GmrSD restriction endonucleases N-terminal domain-containing protein n=1 Tax=Neogemmobacter tilapiae TaxID=875041 RepID=A0A918TQ96_9RHOB|nr:DUF262 domain-containing protein [Gemmobacter tilapiae]GHC56150.1 hypothetical protein GCM10007315_19270 [Gemmobacter tilapiae]
MKILAELASQPTSIQSVYGWHAAERLFVNRRYQRKLVWTLEEKQKLVESILRKYPIPAILLAEKDDGSGHLEIIDGLQRLNAIISFIEGAFALTDGRIFDISSFPTAKARLEAGNFKSLDVKSTITTAEVTAILDYSLAFSVMRKATDGEVDDVFDRINSYGHRLSDQERRQSGIQNDFSELVRKVASKLRGDGSPTIMPLRMMPEVSIDLPMMKHGYDVKADSVFWCKQGILRATDLRDSMDEQCIADIAASIVSGAVLERSKDALDDLYVRDSEPAEQLLGALKVYGAEKFADEFFYCIEQIEKVCSAGGQDEKLRNIIFEERNTNAFPAVFTVIIIAFHEMFIKEKSEIADFKKIKENLTNLTRRIDTSRRATAADERQKNINTIKGIISPCFVKSDQSSKIYSDHKALDVDDYIRRSNMELANYELKQGVLALDANREINVDLLNRVVATICAIANNGPDRVGRVLIGVADKPEHTAKIVELDGVQPRNVGGRDVVGVAREAKALGISLEDYHGIIRKHIAASNLSEPLKSQVLSSIDFNAYYGLGLIIISVPAQAELSYYNDEVYWREGDNTKKADTAKLIASIGQRF